MSPSRCPRPLPLPDTRTSPSRTSPKDTAGQRCPICAALIPTCLARPSSPRSEFPRPLCDTGMATAFAFPWICRLLLPPNNPRRLRYCAPSSPLRIHSPSGLTDQETIAQAGKAQGSVSDRGVPGGATPSAVPEGCTQPHQQQGAASGLGSRCKQPLQPSIGRHAPSGSPSRPCALPPPPKALQQPLLQPYPNCSVLPLGCTRR